MAFQSLDYKNSENQNHFEILILRRKLEVNYNRNSTYRNK